MKKTFLVLTLAATFLGLNRLTTIQKARQAERPAQVAVDLSAFAY
jgi:hypothetical protein